MHIDTEHERGTGPAPLRALEQLGGEQQLAAVILAWYGCNGDVEQLKVERPDLAGEVIEEIMQAYRPLQPEVEDLLVQMIAAFHDLRGSCG